MDKCNELLQRLLDHDLSGDDKRDVDGLLKSDPLFRREYELLSGAILIVENAEKAAVPEGFKSSVMSRLPAKKRPADKKISDLFFGERIFRWNMATALASAFFLIIVLAGIYHLKTAPGPTAYRAPEAGAVRPVRMSFFAPHAKSVAVAGDFNRWSEDAAMMKKINGAWSIELPLKPGVYQYMFVVDGQGWVADPGAESYRDDGFGNRNAVMRVNEI